MNTQPNTGSNRLAIIGGGSWGTALAIVLAPRFSEVRLWVYESDLAARMHDLRENDVFLPGMRLPGNIAPTCDIGAAVENCGIVLTVMPSHHVRAVVASLKPHLSTEASIVSATKGIENGSLLRMSQVIEEVLGPDSAGRIAVLSGPTFAREVAAGEPAAVVIASVNNQLAGTLQVALSGPTFRAYTNSDPVGVELGASLKNVIAIAAGICQGLGLGSNARAALITRGLAEINRLAVAMGYLKSTQPRS
ncbi:MAG: NAD(P)-dependent glycerol-3-phosphate dehydrogenase [Candidatus Solibacter usitatus]|nr:NAD(P)-dependent glycerol-3-phosphate dehydrogenase [Candidatus Solibacter usitatus]